MRHCCWSTSPRGRDHREQIRHIGSNDSSGDQRLDRRTRLTESATETATESATETASAARDVGNLLLASTEERHHRTKLCADLLDRMSGADRT